MLTESLKELAGELVMLYKQKWPAPKARKGRSYLYTVRVEDYEIQVVAYNIYNAATKLRLGVDDVVYIHKEVIK